MFNSMLAGRLGDAEIGETGTQAELWRAPVIASPSGALSIRSQMRRV
jgi:hypothetical protein